MTDLPERTRKALELKVIEVSDGNYLVRSQDRQTWYTVVVHDVHTVSCGCPDARYRDVICKHARAAALAHAKDETISLDDLERP